MLTSLDATAKSLEKYKEDSIYLESEIVKEQFIDLVSDISIYLAEVRGVQNTLYSQQDIIKKEESSVFPNSAALIKWFNENKNQKTIDLVDLKRRISDLIKEMR